MGRLKVLLVILIIKYKYKKYIIRNIIIKLYIGFVYIVQKKKKKKLPRRPNHGGSPMMPP